MNRKLSILVLTDHSNHTEHNSLYALCSALRRQPGIAHVHVASRGNTANAGFFTDYSSTRVRAWSLDGEMHFAHAPYRFLQETVPAELNDYDWIWLRLPHPIPGGFFEFLCSVYPESRIFNRPSGIRETSTKAFLTQFPKWSPDIKLCQSMEDVWEMQSRYPIVLKPLHSYGGQGILKVKNGKIYEQQKPVPIQQRTRELEAGFEQGGFLGMRFLKNVKQGDKRTVVVNGRILGSVLRMPPKGSWLCNAAQGGQAVFSEPDERERKMARELSKVLLPKGIVMFGMDTLVNDEGLRVLSEVNTLSIGGIKPMEDLSGKPMVSRAARQLARFMTARATSGQTAVF
ncbi:MAG: glutathione synthetase [Phaeodactylibacter sp.]|uniref:ATP-grasp domain-containing protein n=1 Tax=Phaeodactylibacter sp. TaxID=1940289 RepID=UPI0032EC32FE